MITPAQLAQEYRRKAAEAFDRSIMALVPGMVGNRTTTNDRALEATRLDEEAKEFRLVAVALFHLDRSDT